MKKYCQYCSNMVCGDANYCSEKQATFTDKQIKRETQCKDFIFNKIDALFSNEIGYQPRPLRDDNDLKNQTKLF